VAKIQQRGAKRMSKMSIMDLPQGPLSPIEPLESIVEEKSYPTVIAQARTNMDKFTNCVVLTRVGGFYEVRPADVFSIFYDCFVLLLKCCLIFLAVLRACREYWTTTEFEDCTKKDRQRTSINGKNVFVPWLHVFA